ncbi:MAG: hypothetical protein SF053_04115 [Bacteroidia bacterium]|nr:hypothetical protein [Bacteroidia bacterium]
MAEPLKHLYNPGFIDRLCHDLVEVEPGFDAAHFRALVFDAAWDERELKARTRHITVCLHAVLDRPYAEALAVLEPVAARQRVAYEYTFFPDYVACYGLDHWDRSMEALAHFTQYSSSEFAVRPFILQDPPRMMAQMLAWTAHPNEHVRRLASEGCRPRLPWAMALPAFKRDPGLVLPILEALKADPALYVRRSVANNLNDISKDHPGLVLDIARRWQGHDPGTDWIIKHATRTLLKRGEQAALTIFGFEPQAVQVSGLTLSPNVVPIGGQITLSCQLEVAATAPVQLRLEYAVHFVKANGTTSPKVFQIREGLVAPGAPVSITLRHAFRQLTTRIHYPGIHRIVLLVNGIANAEGVVEVVE